MANLGDRTYFDACVYTTEAGRDQLRIAALVVAKAVLGYDTDTTRRNGALTYASLLSGRPTALDLCNEVRDVWKMGGESRDAGVDGVKAPMAQLEAVAENVYRGRTGGVPWWGWALLIAGVGGAGLYGYRRYRKLLLPARS